MILVTEAKYDAAVDRVDIVSVIQQDDGTAATAVLDSGVAELLQGSETSVRMEFDRRFVMLLPEDETDGFGWRDVGQFYCFVLHPAQQRSMTARVTATLLDGSTATVAIPVEYRREASRIPTTNPMLTGRENPEFPPEPDKP